MRDPLLTCHCGHPTGSHVLGIGRCLNTECHCTGVYLATDPPRAAGRETEAKVHNHGPSEGPGLSCRERRVDGRLVGDCLTAASREAGAGEVETDHTARELARVLEDARRLCDDLRDQGDHIGAAIVTELRRAVDPALRPPAGVRARLLEGVRVLEEEAIPAEEAKWRAKGASETTISHLIGQMRAQATQLRAEAEAMCPNPHCANGRIRGTDVGCAVCSASTLPPAGRREAEDTALRAAVIAALGDTPVFDSAGEMPRRHLDTLARLVGVEVPR